MIIWRRGNFSILFINGYMNIYLEVENKIKKYTCRDTIYHLSIHMFRYDVSHVC